MRQVVRIDADAVAADQARRRTSGSSTWCRPPRARPRCRCPVRSKIDAKLVHERDVDVALRVLDDLGGLGDLDRRRAVHARGDDDAVDRGDEVERVARLAGDDLDDRLEAVLLVAGVDALGRVAEVEVRRRFEAGALVEDGHADVFGDARVDGRFVDDDVALLEGLPDGLRGRSAWPEVGAVALVDRGRAR